MMSPILGSFNRIFEPTVSVFTNGLVVSYKKVGTRFMRTVSSGGIEACDIDNKQIDFVISKEPITNPDKLLNNKINYKFSSRYVTAPWNTNDYLAHTFRTWKSDVTFLDDMEVSSYTELFFENKKDIIFVIRNPLERFFSGVVQCGSGYFHSLMDNLEEYELFKNTTGFSDDTIKILTHVYKNTQYTDKLLIQSLPEEVIIKTYKYLLHHKWNTLISDIHVQLYLSHVVEWIYNIKDISKVKIVDLKHLRSDKSIKFLATVHEDKEKGLYGEDLENMIRGLPMETNSKITDILIDAYNKGEFNTKTLGMNIAFIENYLGYEYILYNELISSPQFINLED